MARSNSDFRAVFFFFFCIFPTLFSSAFLAFGYRIIIIAPSSAPVRGRNKTRRNISRHPMPRSLLEWWCRGPTLPSSLFRLVLVSVSCNLYPKKNLIQRPACLGNRDDRFIIDWYSKSTRKIYQRVTLGMETVVYFIVLYRIHL